MSAADMVLVKLIAAAPLPGDPGHSHEYEILTCNCVFIHRFRKLPASVRPDRPYSAH